MPIAKEALQRLRAHYNANKTTMPSQQRIADQSGLSESTVQRALSGQSDSIKFETIVKIAPVIGMNTEDLGITEENVAAMDNDDMRALVISLRDMNMRELAAQRKADDERWRERLNADQEKYLARIELLNAHHAEAMDRLKEAHADEMKRSNAAHEQHVTQIHQMYDRQMESMRAANSRQMEMMLEGHALQIQAVQNVDQAQQEALRSMAETQKAADEKSKEFLKGRIDQLDKRSKTKDKIIFALVVCIVMLFVADFFMPSLGWIRRLSSTFFSYHYFG